jgi:site-specific DNA-cytosine methylase
MEKGLLAPAPVWTDLKSFPWENFYGKIHVLTGGYPCQPFSQAGLQRGTDDPRHLFPYFERGIDAARPVCCYFENVENHLNLGFEEVRYRLQRLGYKVEAGIYAAENVGAPHIRKRLFILAVADTYCTEQSKRRGDLAEVLGIPEIQCQPKHRPALSGGDGSQLGDSDGSGSQRRDSLRQSTVSSESGENVDDSTGRGDSTEDSVSTGRNGIACSGSAVDNAISPRLEGQPRNVTRRGRWKETVRSIAASSLWPAGQGAYQHEWEAPRLESSVGFSVDGYSFTEDLLRLAGNGVVPQQAEAAFIDLITEHFL